MVVSFSAGRRLLLGDTYGNSRAYSPTNLYSSSARCHANGSACDRTILLREYRNTTVEDYLYLLEGIVDSQLQYTDVNVPIYVHDTDCTLSSTATGADCLEDCNSLISQGVAGVVVP
ncbi:unnamed protein product [Nippostrongylus brasiliensis]|uniref:Uncharacterized protein n=1 Tax=Nippostrongylus brasiliensis TaxID=27835 RepID=A0A0N4XWR4_NIPBR|nr:unnamed protein product [Nippostrongylus brasiliensis]